MCREKGWAGSRMCRESPVLSVGEAHASVLSRMGTGSISCDLREPGGGRGPTLWSSTGLFMATEESSIAAESVHQASPPSPCMYRIEPLGEEKDEQEEKGFSTSSYPAIVE